MNYFLLHPENQNELVHLPDCKITEGKREVVEKRVIGGHPVFLQGHKQPDLCVFSLPHGIASHSPCRIVDETGLVRQITANVIETDAHRFLSAGVVTDQYAAVNPEKAKEVIAAAVKKLTAG